ncbi:DNA-binding GntR family transcriptional regulator [Nocardioides zeae]|uniref:DNA-binding GntR family transcriptional regulator n=1 Tax=Nocardioides zeae TaxID=1457234 RepID=A0ACC6IF55_9ACTN|nr:GntR family transcriptional regulator [Nocardioides zeae]MDR6174891.1 DNA-binding GntR family transcriptional regulator [Nocardioides zeae]MDR6209299.1 DNA-binding GntR family transcriptional regulator [Nocardioides zeae]
MDSAVAQQYERIRAAILHGEHRPGAVLRETVLSADQQVSRTPVREALARLAQEGLLTKGVRGYRVRERTPREMLDVFDARTVLETGAARMAAQRRTDAELARLRDLTEAIERESEVAVRARLNTLWHHAIVDAAHNDTMVGMFEQLHTLLAIYRPLHAGRDDAATAADERQEHRAILDAIDEEDGERAGREMARHLERGRQVRLGLLLDAGVRRGSTSEG